VSKPAICLVNKMDTDAGEQNYNNFLKQLADNKNEEYLKNLADDCRPRRLIQGQILRNSISAENFSYKFS
jgi:F0F1-type ATP synthase delta subunit